MEAGEDRLGPVVEALTAVPILVALRVGLGVIPADLDDQVGGAPGARHAVRSADLPDRLIARGVVEEILDVHHRSTPQVRDSGVDRADERPDGSARL